ncbi:hypothetical protein [Lactobacillus acetotolerans]|uniref:hypothetical protein n=1 Tax=Lactobacillus acetotolerans TaxID=1600 RepID=UPI002FD931FE
MEIQLKNKYTQRVIEAPVGYSWTLLLFGAFVPLFRKDWQATIVLMVLNLSVYFLGGYIAELIIDAVFAALYNKYFIAKMLNSGWEPLNKASQEAINHL